MKAEDLLDAMEYVDNELILEAEEKPARRRLPLWQVATAGAAAFVVCAGVYLLPALQPAGVAAPESERQETHNGVVSDVMDVTEAPLTAGADDQYKYTADQSAVRAPSVANKDAAGETASGVFEPVFRTEQGRYLLVGEELPLKSKLPDGMRYLGELTLTAPDEVRYPSVGTKELVGCAVWQSEDGEYLYIQNPTGGWLQATKQK